MADRNPKHDPVGADHYRALFDYSADAILIIENDKFVDCNQAAVDILGYTDKEALLQCHPSELSPEYQPDGRRSLEKANEILGNTKQCRSQRFEWDHLKADGSLLPVEVTMTAIPTDDGNTLHIIWRDLSEQKRLESQLRHSQKMEALGSLAGGIAHDFNNTLVPIVTYSDLLANSLRDRPQLREWAQEISRAGVLAASLVKKLLAVSRHDDRIPVTLDLEATVSGTLGLLRKLIGEDIEIRFEPSGNPLWIENDPGDVEQILLNLASNARDALPTGGVIRLALSNVRRSGRPFARLEFSDNGVGMDDGTRERMFEPFFTTKEIGSGTGLGMSSVYELVTRAHGHVDAKSSLGEGTAIEVLLPIIDHQEIDESDMAGEDTSPRDGPHVNAQVLVVEDDVQITRLICKLLDQDGFRVCTARNGAEALETLETITPDLILSDVVMPLMSGPKMIREMNARGIQIPVVFLSGYTDDRLAAHAFDSGTVSLLRKPFTARMLLGRVRRAVGSAR